MLETQESVAQDLYQKGYDELSEALQNTVEIELEARLNILRKKWYDVLVSEATAYDDRQSKKKGHNPYAYSQYLDGIKNAIANADFLTNPKKALAAEFLIKDETGGIYHRNLPQFFDDVKFSLSFVNSAVKKMNKGN